MRLYLALMLVTAGIAFAPTADACPSLASCVPDEVAVCPAAAPWACVEFSPREALERILEPVIGPCTCPPL